MNASETILQPLIEGSKQYVVPLFQRPYSWTKKEWEVLWNDLVDLCQSGQTRSHFVGSIVTMPTSSVPEGVSKFILIDGQQRLTTIHTLLTMLRDQAKAKNQATLAEEIEKTLLVNPYSKGLDYYKLLPTQVDRENFQKLVRGEAKSGSSDQVTQAYRFFERKYRQLTLDPESLKAAICRQLVVVSIVLDADDNPHLVFESLNAKGLPLTQSDLIRNYFFMRIHIDEQETIYAQFWNPMQDALKENLTECIRHFLGMKNASVVKQTEVYFALKEMVTKQDAIDSLREIARFAQYYEKLLNPELETHSGISYLLTRLNRLKVTTAYPFLLRCYDRYARDELLPDEFVTILKVIENFILRRFVCNVPTNQLNSIFSPMFNQVESLGFGSLADGVRLFLQSKNYPRDHDFKFNLMNHKLYGSGDRTVRAKLILESIEEFHGNKERVPFDNLSVEHVMPQTPTEYWQAELGENWQETHETLLHTIGNLTLTAYNPELSNNDFESKKARFRDSHLDINRYFEETNSWRKEDIEKRSEYLAHLCLQIWPYFGDEKTKHEESLSVTSKTPKGLCILGQHYAVGSWRDVLERTVSTIAELEPEKVDQLMQEYPHFVGRNRARFRDARELPNGIFIEVNLSAKSIQAYCTQALSAVGLTTDEWNVEMV
jgi:uncharacterized protein with ParB-like and HNH nuclease domain